MTTALQIAERDSPIMLSKAVHVRGTATSESPMPFVAILTVDTVVYREWSKTEQKQKEVRKMDPRIEDYMDSTCVASTGGLATMYY